MRDVDIQSNDGYSVWGGRGAAVVLRKNSSRDWYRQATLMLEVADCAAKDGVSVNIYGEFNYQIVLSLCHIQH